MPAFGRLLACAALLSCGGAAPCHALAQRGDEIAAEVVDGGLPRGEGGALVDGTYVCTRYRWFRPTDARAHRCTLVLTGPDAEIVEDVRDAAGLSSSQSSVRLAVRLVVLDGGALRAEQTCPRPVNLPFDAYTAKDGELTLISSSNAQAVTFTRR